MSLSAVKWLHTGAHDCGKLGTFVVPEEHTVVMVPVAVSNVLLGDRVNRKGVAELAGEQAKEAAERAVLAATITARERGPGA